MTTKEYIESGILEAYVLGALTQSEEAQVQADIARDPELAKEIAILEETMLNYAIAESMTPPVALKDKIWDTIQASATSAQQPASVPPVSSANGGDVARPKTIPLAPPVRNTQWRYAAIWVVLAGSMSLNAIFWFQNSKQKQQFAEQAITLNNLAEQQKTLAAVVENYQKNKSMMADTAMQTIVMHTMQKGHSMAATVYWSKDKAEAYVMIDALPEPPKGMQYQLWVMQDGKPVDIGVLPVDMANTANIQKVGMPVARGEAFAITLEKAGGSPSPTMANLYVMGKV